MRVLLDCRNAFLSDVAHVDYHDDDDGDDDVLVNDTINWNE